MLGIQDLVFPFFFSEASVQWVVTSSGHAQASLLLAIAVGLGLFDLGRNGLALGRAAGQLRGLLRSQQGALIRQNKLKAASDEKTFIEGSR